MKLLLLESEPEITKEYLYYLEDAGYDLVQISNNFDRDEIVGLIFRSAVKFDKELLDKYMNVKFVFRVGVGLDNVNLKLCEKRGIKVFNSPCANSDSVADLAIWGTLSLLRKVKDIGNNDLDKKSRFDYMGNELSEKNIAIVGFGQIGKKIYQRLVGFGVKSFYIIDPFVTEDEVTNYINCEKYENIFEIGNEIDILYTNMPLNSQTKGYLNRDVLSVLKSDVKIVNIARGGLINFDDMHNFLKKNMESSVYMDISYNKELDKINKLDNCIITPHIGAMTSEANMRMHKFDIRSI